MEEERATELLMHIIYRETLSERKREISQTTELEIPSFTFTSNQRSSTKGPSYGSPPRSSPELGIGNS